LNLERKEGVTMRPRSHHDPAQIIEKQLLLWKQKNPAGGAGSKVLLKSAAPITFGPYITISRDFGAGGRSLAEVLSTRLGWVTYDRKLIDGIAEKAHVRRSVVESLDERGRIWIRDYVASLSFAENLSENEFFTHLINMAVSIAQHGRAVLVGRGLHLVLPPEAGVRIRLTAPVDFRVRWFKSQEPVSREEAVRRVKMIDDERADYIRQYFSRDISDVSTFDKVYDTSRILIEDIATEVMDLLRIKVGTCAAQVLTKAA
jgi:cytidylate kinase